MLRIFDNQLAEFAAVEHAKFVEQMVLHGEDYLPTVALSLSDEDLRRAIVRALERAESHGLTSDGPIRSFVEFCMLFGCDFDTDPLHPWARRCLAKPKPETEAHRAENLYADGLNVVGKLLGEDDQFVDAAYERLRQWCDSSEVVGLGDVEAMALTRMADVYPEKYAFAGDEALRVLIGEAQEQAAGHGLEVPSDVVLLALLMFTLGHGCAADAVYSWIGEALRDDDPNTDVGRALRESAMQWLVEDVDTDETPDARLSA